MLAIELLIVLGLEDTTAGVIWRRPFSENW
jgi:hypothetical protein